MEGSGPWRLVWSNVVGQHGQDPGLSLDQEESESVPGRLPLRLLSRAWRRGGVCGAPWRVEAEIPRPGLSVVAGKAVIKEKACSKGILWLHRRSTDREDWDETMCWSPPSFYHPETEVCLEVHVDDFYAVGPGDSAGQLLKRMAKYMTLTLEGPFDVGSTFVHLKRVRTVTPEGLYISATSSHLKKLLKLTDLTENSKGKDTPITKSVVEDGDEPTAELSPEETTRFRAVVGILMYMSTDRPDIQYVVNELSGAMSKPTQRSWEAAKDLVRYLIRTKGYALFFDREVNNCDDVVVMTDSDWATDRQSRRSKSASHIYVGNCLLYSFTRRQTVVAQSSAEAEYYATTSGVSEGILIRKVLAFFNLPLGLRSVTDSAANNAMAHRLGVGKVRHLETKVLWLQHLVYNGFLTMSWSPGKYNNSDQGTKVLQKARFQELVKMTGLRDLEENDVKIQQVVNVLAQNAGPSKEQVGQALATLVGWLQVQQASGLETESETSEESSLLIMMASAVFLIGLLAGCLMTMLVWWWRRVRSPKLIFYKGPMSVVLHLDKGCHYLKKTKKVEEWTLCQWCSRVKLKIDWPAALFSPLWTQATR